MRACVIFNPAARGDRAQGFRQQLAGFGADCVFKPTEAAGMGRTLAAAAIAEGFDTLVAVGGDGTVNEVLNGIVEVPDGRARARLAVLPLGTANVFARELRIPFDLRRAWDVVCRGRELRIDLVRAAFQREGGPAQRYLAQLAGAGLDARSVELMQWDTKKRLAHLAYVLAGFRALRENQPTIAVRVDGLETRGQLVLVGNGRFYGGPFTLFPKATLDDGLLDATVFPRVTSVVVARCLLGALCGRLPHFGGARFLRGARIELASDARVPFQIDGDAVGELPAVLTIERQALRVLVP